MELKEKHQRGMRIIPPGDHKCVWMEAGVVNYKLCANQYQCYKCEFDHAMTARADQDKMADRPGQPLMTQKKKIVDWMEEFRQLPANQRKCRYMLMGEVNYKICPNSFRCGECTYDQMMQDRHQPPIIRDMDSLPKVAGFYMPQDLHYFRNHTWLHLQRTGKIRVGVDDFARRLIGEVQNIQLPAVGQVVSLEEYFLTLRHDFGDLEVFSPVEGVVEAVNYDLLEEPHLLTDFPYSDGWIVNIDPTSIGKTLKNLLKDEDASAWMGEEASLLQEAVHMEAGATLQDGAVLTTDMSKNLPRQQWHALVKKHLYTR